MANGTIPNDVLSNVGYTSSDIPFVDKEDVAADGKTLFLNNRETFSADEEEELLNSVFAGGKSSQEEIIKSLRVKNTQGFNAPVFLGTDPYFVGAIRGTSLNNLEEEMIFGVDCITTSWEESDGTKKSIKEFRREGVYQNYYKIESSIYPEGGGPDPTPGGDDDDFNPIQWLDGEWQWVVPSDESTLVDEELTLKNKRYSFVDPDTANWGAKQKAQKPIQFIDGEWQFVIPNDEINKSDDQMTLLSSNYSVEDEDLVWTESSGGGGGISEEYLLYFVNAEGQEVLISKKEVLQSIDDLGRTVTKEIITNYM